jgi:hypothetical protein
LLTFLVKESFDLIFQLDDGNPVDNGWNVVHSIALHEPLEILCAADRENSRIKCFNSTTGDFLRQIRLKGKEICPIYAIEFAPDSTG